MKGRIAAESYAALAASDLGTTTNEVMAFAIAKKAEVVFIENLQLFCERGPTLAVSRRKAGQVELSCRDAQRTWR